MRFFLLKKLDSFPRIKKIIRSSWHKSIEIKLASKNFFGYGQFEFVGLLIDVYKK